MKTKQHTLIALLVLVFLAGGAFAALTAKNEQAAQAESAAVEGTIPLSSFAADDLTELAVTYNGETNTLTVADGSWTLAEDPAYHLDATACNTMVTALSALNAKRQLTEEPGEDYGFTDASLTVTVTAAGETNTFTFGAENAATGDIYLKKAGDDALYTVAASKAACFALSRAELFGAFNPAGLTRSAIESVALAYGDEPFTLTAVSEAAESDRSADSDSDSDSTAYTTVWRLADAPDAELDETQVSSLLFGPQQLRHGAGSPRRCVRHEAAGCSHGPHSGRRTDADLLRGHGRLLSDRVGGHVSLHGGCRHRANSVYRKGPLQSGFVKQKFIWKSFLSPEVSRRGASGLFDVSARFLPGA